MFFDPLLVRDGAKYLYQAELWNESGVYSKTYEHGGDYIPPLPLYILKESLKSGYTTEVCGRSIALMLGSILPVLGYFLGKRLFKKESISLMIGILLSVNPGLVKYSIQPLRENFYLFTGFIVLYELFFIRKENMLRNAFLCGLFTTISFFCRYEAAEFVAIFFLVTIFMLFGKKIPHSLFWKSAICFMFSATASFLVLLKITNGNLRFIEKIPNYITTDTSKQASIGIND